MKWLVRGIVALVVCYLGFFGVVLFAMVQPPERFGSFMKHAPQPLVWVALPASRMWLWARQGDLVEGALAPDFNLATLDRASRVTLSDHRGKRPVVLVFGSYT
jgi:hypothetical protein